MATTSSISVFRKTDTDLKITVTDQDGAVIDIDRVAFTVKEKKTDADANAKIQLESHDSGGTPDTTKIEITDGPNGKATIKLTDALTDIAAGSFFYDIKVRKVGGTFHVPLLGSFTIEGTITTRNPDLS